MVEIKFYRLLCMDTRYDEEEEVHVTINAPDVSDNEMDSDDQLDDNDF